MAANMLLNVKEAAEVLGISTGVLARLARDGVIGCYKFGSNTSPRKFSKKHIQDFLLKYESRPREDAVISEDIFNETSKGE